MQPNQGYYNQGYNQYQYQEAPVGAHIYQVCASSLELLVAEHLLNQNSNYHHQNDGMESPTRTQERPVLVEQGRYSRATNTGRQQAQPAPDKENKMPDAWEVEWGEEGTLPAPYAGRENPWRPKDDKLLLKMRAGEKPAPWSEVVGTLYDKQARTMPDAAAMSSRRLLSRMGEEIRNMMDLRDRKSRSSGRVSTSIMSLHFLR
jgi:hypothetical protein